MVRRVSGNGGGGVRAVTRPLFVPSASGVIYTVRSPLKSPVTWAKTGGNANLSVNSATGAVSAAVAIAVGTSQAINLTATGADGCVQPWALNCTGMAQIAAITANVSLSAAAGYVLANIIGVPSGQSPVLTPADGRFVIAGDEATGWKLARGLAAIDIGIFSGAISAVNALSGVVTITINTVPVGAIRNEQGGYVLNASGGYVLSGAA